MLVSRRINRQIRILLFKNHAWKLQNPELRNQRSRRKILALLKGKQPTEFLNTISHLRDDNFNYDIVHLTKLTKLLSQITVCKFCGALLEIISVPINGLAKMIKIQCRACEHFVTEPNSEQINYESGEESQLFYDINIRNVFAMRSIGRGRNAAVTFNE